MKYFVDVQAISYASTIEVEASNAEEAEEIAQDLYFSGRINWGEADVSYEARPDERERGVCR